MPHSIPSKYLKNPSKISVLKRKSIHSTIPPKAEEHRKIFPKIKIVSLAHYLILSAHRIISIKTIGIMR